MVEPAPPVKAPKERSLSKEEVMALLDEEDRHRVAQLYHEADRTRKEFMVMPNATPREFRRHYQIYPNKICLNESPSNCRHCTEGMVTSLGRRIGSGFGDTMEHPDRVGSWEEKVIRP